MDRPPGDDDTPFRQAVARLSERRFAFQRELAEKKEAALRSAYEHGCPNCGAATHPEALVMHDFPGETRVEDDVLYITARFRIFCVRCDPIQRT